MIAQAVGSSTGRSMDAANIRPSALGKVTCSVRCLGVFREEMPGLTPRGYRGKVGAVTTGNASYPPQLRPVTGPLRWVLVAVGTVSVGLGAVGAILPLLPTTPFLLLAVLCFARSSERMHTWLLAHRWFGPYIVNYYAGTMTKRQLVQTLCIMWIGLGVSAYLIGKPVVWIVFAILGTSVSIHLLTLKWQRARTSTAGHSGTGA